MEKAHAEYQLELMQSFQEKLRDRAINVVRNSGESCLGVWVHFSGTFFMGQNHPLIALAYWCLQKSLPGFENSMRNPWITTATNTVEVLREIFPLQSIKGFSVGLN